MGVGIYPSIIIRDDAVQPIYKALLDYPEFDGFTSYSPPRAFMDNTNTLGTLTSSSNVLKAELSRASLAVSWTNVARTASYALDGTEMVDLLERMFKTMGRDIGGMAMFQEYLVKAPAEKIEGIFTSARRKKLLNFGATLGYKKEIGDLGSLDVNYSVSSVIGDPEWVAAFKDHKYIVSANTSMPDEPSRVIDLKKIKGFASTVLAAHTGEKLLADLSDGGE
jgi:hypothetical protein